MKIRNALVMMLFVFLFVVPNLAFADDALVVADCYPPWKICAEGNVTGIDIELLQAILAPHNLNMQIKEYPWARCLNMMAVGTADFLTGVLKRPDREEFMHYIEPPYKTKSVKAFYLRKGEGHLLQKYEDLYNLSSVGVVIDVKYFEPFDTDPKIKKDPIPDDLNNLKKLVAGRVQAVVMTDTYADYLIATEGFIDQVEKAPYQYERDVPVYMTLSKKSRYADMLPALNATAKELAENGTFDKIIAEFFEKLYADQQ